MRIGAQEPTISITIKDYAKSGGDLAVKLYELTGRKAMDWQKALIFDILAMDEENRWVHSKIGYSVPRRNGKGEVLTMRELYGLAKGEHIIHTAHLTSTAHAGWERMIGLLEAIGLKRDQDYTQIKAKGQERIQLKDGGLIEFRTRTEKGALGEGFDLLIIDEAQEYQITQESTLKYIVTDSKNPQTIMCGTPPTAISSGTVFKDFRNGVLQGKAPGRHAWVEWSVDEMSDVDDVDLWYACNPSLGQTLDERDVADEVDRTGSGRIDFNIQRLGLWLKYNQQSAISKNAWNGTLVSAPPKLIGKLAIGIKFSKDGNTVVLAIASKTEDEHIFVEVYKRANVHEGLDWIVDLLTALKGKTIKIVVDGASGQEVLKNLMKGAKLSEPKLPTVKEIVEANATFENGIYQKNLQHMEQPSLTQVVSSCEHRAIGSSGGFGYKPIISDLDPSLIEATALAYWAAYKYKPIEQKISY